MSAKLLFMCTHGKDDAERATLPFVAAHVARTAGQDATVICTIDAVWLGTRGGAEDVAAPGLPPLAKLLSDFVGQGGKVWLCGACTKPRNITDERLAPGVSIVGAAKIVEEIAGGASSTSFA